MNKKLLSLLLSFLILGFVSNFAQEEEAEDIQAFVNADYQQSGGYSIFDSSPIYGSDWEWLHQQPNGNTLRWVKMWDATNWYAVGFGGTFMKTTDAGATWFVNKWVNGGGTTDINYPLYDAYFSDMNTGLACGGYGTVVRTTDAGETWVYVGVDGTTAATWYDMYFANDTLGFVCGTTSGRLAVTTDGGLTWAANGTIASGTYYSVYAEDGDTILVFSTSGNLRRSTNAGVTWATINVGFSATLYSNNFTDPLNGWVVGSSGNAGYTNDGGLTWTSVGANIPVTSTLYDVDILSTMSQTLNESFEDVTFPPAGWHTKNLLGANVWSRSTTYAHTGVASARIGYQFTGGDDWLVTPQVNVVTGDSLVFWWRNAFSSPYPPDSLIIRISTTDTAVASFTSILVKIDGATAPNVFTRHAYSLDSYTGNVYIAFQHTNLDGNGGYLDDVTVGEPMMASQVFVTGDAFNIYSTADMGTTWTPVQFLDPSQPWTSTFYSTDWLAPNNFVTVGGFGLINEVNPVDAIIAHTLFIKAGTLYDVWAQSASGNVIACGTSSSATAFDQAIYSTDGGDTWAVSTMLDSADLDFNSISMVSATTGFTAGEDHRVMKTTDAGASWFRLTDPATSTSDLEMVFFLDENTGYTFGTTGLGYKTTDGGTSWTALTTGISGTIYSANFVDAMNGYIVGSSGAGAMTTDGGTTFTPMTTNMQTSAIYSIWMVNSNVGYLCGSTGKVRKTVDGGVTWDTVDVGNTSPTLYSIEFRNENNGMVVGSSGRTYYTNDGGATWVFENTSMSTIYGVGLEFTSPDTAAAYVVGTNAYVMRNHHVIVPVELASFSASVNGNDVTLSWMTATELNNSGFSVERTTEEQGWTALGFVQGHGTTTETQVYSFIDKGLAAGTYSYRIKQVDYDGSYKYFDLQQDVEISAPISYALSQNYPNPFNPTTKIKYAVPFDGFVNIAVFNVLGEKVANVINSLHKAGNYEFTFDATNLASGMYIYRMEAGNFVSIKKMMILK